MAAKKPDEKPDTPNAEVETEQGFGTGLRAQLQRRRDSGSDATADVTSPTNADTPFVRVDLYAAPPPAAAEAASAAADDGAFQALNGEVDALRGDLAAAAKREQELRAALAEQVEAYERRLTEESVVSREAVKLDERGAQLSATETHLREREQNIASQRREVDNERKRLMALKSELAAEQ